MGRKATKHQQASQPSDGAGPSTAPVQNKREDRFTMSQALLKRGWMPEGEARNLYRAICTTDSDAGYAGMITDINKALEYIQLGIRSTRFPVDEEWYVAVVNKVADEVVKCATRLSIAQRLFFQAVVDTVALKTGCQGDVPYISSTEALNLAISPPQSQAQSQGATQVEKVHLTLSQKEDTLAALVQDGWLAFMPRQRGCYTLGVRTLLELSDYLLELDLPHATRAAWEAVV